MIDKGLINYIKEAQAKGFSNEVVQQALLGAGWSEAQVSEAIQVVLLENSAPAPTPASIPAIPEIPKTSLDKSIIPEEPVSKKHIAELYSPYSKIVSSVLIFSLFILLYNLINDLVDPYKTAYANNYFSFSPEALIAESLIIIPFWGLTFFLSYKLQEWGKKFNILLFPYFLNSGWLLIKLLWDVSRFILDSSAAFGVYFVLILLAIILTGSVIFIQRFAHKHKVNT